MPNATVSKSAVVDADTLLRLTSQGMVTLLAESLQLETGGVIPPQEIRVDFFDLIAALSEARASLTEALDGHDPLDRPEDRKVNSDT